MRVRRNAWTKKFFNRQAGTAYLFLLPNFLGFMAFIAFPFVAAILLALTEWDGYKPIQWVGIDNFVRMFGNETFLISLKNTVLYTSFSCLLLVGFSILLALFVNGKLAGVQLFRAALFFPYITSFIAVAVVWQALFNPDYGPINMVLKHFTNHPPGWLISSDWALASIIIVTVWKESGYYMILFLAGLQGIPESLYEAAKIDGAGPIKRFFHITMPMLSPVTFFVVVTAVIKLFKSFDLVYIMTEGGPGRATSLLVYDIYIQGFKNLKFGYSAAEAIILLAIILLVTIVQFRRQKSWVNY